MAELYAARLRIPVRNVQRHIDFKGRGGGAEADSLEDQIYLTGGIYHRADLHNDERVSWAMVLDGLFTDNLRAFASRFPGLI